MKYYIITFGCQMNKSDSERIAAVLEKIGYKKARNIEVADLIVVNMCSVRQSAVDRVYGKIKDFNKLKVKNEKLKVILTGCILGKDRKKFAQYFDYILNIKEILNLPYLLKLKTKPPENCSPWSYLKIEPKYSSFPMAYVPISNGCNNFCTYCVVPYTRGHEQYRDKKEIICEISELIKKGFKEIILLGQNVNSYPNFVGLLQNITDLTGDFKIKFITNHPKNFSDELIEEVARNDKIVKYIHLPVQSGDNEILKKMNRNYTREQYLLLVKKIKNKIPNVELTTDVIVGFPGETKKQFQATFDIFKRIKFANAYIAKYSPRENTAAYKLKDNILLEEKKRREKILRDYVKSQK